MPNEAQPISDLASVLLEREMARDPEQFKQTQQINSQSGSGISPQTLATIGGLMDAASTYAFMKRGTAKEANPLVNMIARGNPELTGLTAIGGLLATKGLTSLIGKKWPKAADAIAANLGAQQLAMGTRNTANTFGLRNERQGSFGAYGDTMIRSGINESNKNHSR